MIKAFRLLMVLLVIATASGRLYAQNAKLYLNNKEIAFQSVHFLDASTIDSINFYTGTEANAKLNLQTTGVDSVYVIFERDLSDVVSYYQLLERYHLDNRARALPLDLNSGRYDYVKDPQLMMFSINRVTRVAVEMAYKTGIDYINIDHMYNRPYMGPYKGIGSAKARRTLTWLQGYFEGYGDNFYYKQYKGK
ncbi:MAG: hypothetical protein V4560_08605 [Bacteroidota bacterium]